MKENPGVTLTGVDERTNIGDILDLASQDAEIGILYTFDPEGRHRYPSADWICKCLQALSMLSTPRSAVHICGARAKAELLDGRLPWLHFAGRVQINGHLLLREINAARRILRPDIDDSGGRGISPDFWYRPRTDKPVGFAGGLGPDNLRDELRKIATVAKEPWWVDMEGKLRTADDWFDVRKAHAALAAVGEFRLTMRPTRMCRACSGTGKVIEEGEADQDADCLHCDGTGRMATE